MDPDWVSDALTLFGLLSLTGLIFYFGIGLRHAKMRSPEKPPRTPQHCKCPTCDGNQACTECGGKGVLDGRERCRTCDGSGDCWMCHGSGEIPCR